jgi:hypothetical protein
MGRLNASSLRSSFSTEHRREISPSSSDLRIGVRIQVSLIKDWPEVATEVAEKQSLVISLQQSALYAMFRDQIDGWAKRLATLQEGVGSLAALQRKWAHLEPIFSRGALPSQSSRFRQVRSLCIACIRTFEMRKGINYCLFPSDTLSCLHSRSVPDCRVQCSVLGNSAQNPAA